MSAGESPRILLSRGSEQLAEAGVPSPAHDARALLLHVVGTQRPLEILDAVSPDAAAHYADLISRRARREPLQHITGTVTFRMAELTVRPGVFIPRPETEIVAGAAIDAANAVADPHGTGFDGRVPLVVDLCCGSGAIACAVAWETRGGAQIVAVDASDDAVTLSAQNFADLGFDGYPPHAVLLGDVTDPGLLADLHGAVDVVVSNPPYIPDGAIPRDPEVTEWDPPMALYGGGPEGEAIPRAVAARAAELLREGGVFVMEHGDVQGESMRALVAATGSFAEITTGRDLTERDRYVRAVRLSRVSDGRL